VTSGAAEEPDAFEAWRARRAVAGDSCGLLALYDEVARRSGVLAAGLSREERRALAERALPVLYPGHDGTPTRARDDPVEIVAYDDAWPDTFARWRAALCRALGPLASHVAHVGSTAVPGLPAKPVVDVQVSVPDQTDESAYVPAVEGLGVQLRSRDDAHRFFRPFADRPREVHVHVCTAGGGWERDHLLFRDHLRRDPAARDAYAAAKREAAAVWADDRPAYTEAKGAIIRRLLAEAEEWAARTGWTAASAPGC
jgi:GrpB-like predicted nucleotidyltransferase (UPF0157 family)